MRMIKFRIFNKKIKSYIDIHSSAIMIDELNNLNDNLIVEQFTGLHDKTGKEIYEGDIICRKKIRGLDKYKIVIWHNAYVATGFNISDTKERIIIGNIYDNPELVEKP